MDGRPRDAASSPQALRKDPPQRADVDVIRMVKELNDQRPDQVEVEIPRTIAEIRAMSTEEIEQALMPARERRRSSLDRAQELEIAELHPVPQVLLDLLTCCLVAG